MKKWTAVLLTGAMFAATCLGGTITAFAGVTKEKPIGSGLSDGAGINPKFTVEDNADPSSFQVNAADFSVRYAGGWAWQEAIVGKPVPKELMAKDDVKVTLMYNFLSKAAGQQIKFIPAAHSADEKDTYGFVLGGGATDVRNTIDWVEAQRKSASDNDPTVVLHGSDDGSAFTDTTLTKGISVGWQCRGFDATLVDCIAAGKKEGGWFRLEMTVNDHDWVDVSIQSGYVTTGDTFVWNPPQSKIDNWAPYDGSYDFHANLFTTNAEASIIDGAKLEVSYTEDGEPKNEVLFETNLDDTSKVITEAGAAAKDDCFIARGVEYASFSDTEVLVTDPNPDFRFVSKKDLKAAEDLTETFNMKANYHFYAMGDDNKVGIAFGLKDKDAKLSAPGTDVTFLYLAKLDTADIAIGVDNIAADGMVTPVTPTDGEVRTKVKGKGEKINADDPSYVKLTIVGNSATSLTVSVQFARNENIVTLTFEGLHLDGRFAFTQTGTGSVKYGINSDSVKVTGYSLTENEGEKVTANFDGNYVDYGKFDVQSNLAAAGEMQKRPTTAHDITGITPENGRVGFYGTGTNTRLMFKKQYSDFVLQFDYISETYKQRGESLVESKIYNPLMMTFGVKGDGSIQTLDAGYGIAIIDGNPGQGQWGGESIVMCHAATKFASEGLGGTCTTVLSTLKEAAAESDTTILASGGALDGKWCEPNVDPDTGYSFYNRTTRIKLVVLNNKFTVYVAPVEADGTVGTYRKVLENTVSDSNGYVGFATDSPAWCAIDNVALTPISKDVAIAQAANPTYDQTIVADVAPEDMEKDIAPAPLEKPQLTIDGTKVKWQAIDGVEYYHVVVTLGGETKLDKIYVNPEADLSTITAPGDYTVKVTAIPADLENHFESSATITYTVAEAAAGGDTNTQEEGKKGCGSAIGGWAAGGILLTAAAAVLIALPRRKKNK